MTYGHAFEQGKERAFDAYCKIILRNEARDLYRKRKRRREREVAFCELSDPQVVESAVMDEYFAFAEAFNACGIPIVVCDGSIAAALKRLSPERRSIVLLSYFLRMSDREIGCKLGMKRSTVQYQRSKALSQLRVLMDC